MLAEKHIETIEALCYITALVKIKGDHELGNHILGPENSTIYLNVLPSIVFQQAYGRIQLPQSFIVQHNNYLALTGSFNVGFFVCIQLVLHAHTNLPSQNKRFCLLVSVSITFLFTIFPLLFHILS